jgi:DNA invertase Pin-like site-specific DNA recombinase
MSTSFAYCRQSTEQQASIGMQTDTVKTLAERHDRALPEKNIRKEVESAISVPYNKRPEFCKIMQEIQPGDWLFAWRMDRLERNPFQLPNVMQWLMNNKITLCTQMEGVIDMTTLHGRMLVYGQQMICDMFKTYLIEATRAGMMHIKKNGFSVGYRIGRDRVVVKGTKTNRGTPRHTYVWSEHDMATIREVYRRRQAGESLAAIAEDFHNQGLRTCEGRPWVPRRSKHKIYARRGPWSDRRVRQCYTWYQKFVKRGCEPEWFDPNTSCFKTHDRWGKEDEALIREVMAKLGKFNVDLRDTAMSS